MSPERERYQKEMATALSWILYPRRSAKKLAGLAIFAAAWAAVIALASDSWRIALLGVGASAAVWLLGVAYFAVRWMLCDFTDED